MAFWNSIKSELWETQILWPRDCRKTVFHSQLHINISTVNTACFNLHHTNGKCKIWAETLVLLQGYQIEWGSYSVSERARPHHGSVRPISPLPSTATLGGSLPGLEPGYMWQNTCICGLCTHTHTLPDPTDTQTHEERKRMNTRGDLHTHRQC